MTTQYEDDLDLAWALFWYPLWIGVTTFLCAAGINGIKKELQKLDPGHEVAVGAADAVKDTTASEGEDKSEERTITDSDSHPAEEDTDGTKVGVSSKLIKKDAHALTWTKQMSRETGNEDISQNSGSITVDTDAKPGEESDTVLVERSLVSSSPPSPSLTSSKNAVFKETGLENSVTTSDLQSSNEEEPLLSSAETQTRNADSTDAPLIPGSQTETQNQSSSLSPFDFIFCITFTYVIQLYLTYQFGCLQARLSQGSPLYKILACFWIVLTMIPLCWIIDNIEKAGVRLRQHIESVTEEECKPVKFWNQPRRLQVVKAWMFLSWLGILAVTVLVFYHLYMAGEISG